MKFSLAMISSIFVALAASAPAPGAAIVSEETATSEPFITSDANRFSVNARQLETSYDTVVVPAIPTTIGTATQGATERVVYQVVYDRSTDALPTTSISLPMPVPKQVFETAAPARRDMPRPKLTLPVNGGVNNLQEEIAA